MSTAMRIATSRRILLTYMFLSRPTVCNCRSLLLYHLCSACTKITAALRLPPATLWMGAVLWSPGPELIKSSGRSPPPHTWQPAGASLRLDSQRQG